MVYGRSPPRCRFDVAVTSPATLRPMDDITPDAVMDVSVTAPAVMLPVDSDADVTAALDERPAEVMEPDTRA